SLFKPKRVPVLGSNSMEDRREERKNLISTLAGWVCIETNWPFEGEFDAKVIKKYRCVVGPKAETPAPVPGPRGNPEGGVNRVTVPVAGSTVPIHASHPVGPQSLFKPKRVPANAGAGVSAKRHDPKNQTR